MTDELRPFLVTAPLTIDCDDVINTSTIYIFDYENSFVGQDNRPTKIISYLQSYGGMFDIHITDAVSYEDKEKLLVEYFTCGVFMNIFSLVQTMIHCLFVYKDIEYTGTRSIFTNDECSIFIKNNEDLIKQMVTLYDSLFVVMLMFVGTNLEDIKSIRPKYSSKQIIREELSPNMCSLLLDTSFYNYYSKHISSNLYYYEFLFENRLYKGRGFENIIKNDNNTLLPLLMDLGNEEFLKFVKEKEGQI